MPRTPRVRTGNDGKQHRGDLPPFDPGSPPLPFRPAVASRSKTRSVAATRTVTAIEAAIAKLPPRQKWEIVKWLEESLLSEETPAMLAALDEGILSLATEPTVSAEEVRQKIKGWATA